MELNKQYYFMLNGKKMNVYKFKSNNIYKFVSKDQEFWQFIEKVDIQPKLANKREGFS